MDSLISMKATGTPEEFAEKLGIRRSTLFLSLQEMREMGVDIKYSCYRQSYFYADNRRIRIKLAFCRSLPGGLPPTLFTSFWASYKKGGKYEDRSGYKRFVERRTFLIVMLVLFNDMV